MDSIPTTNVRSDSDIVDDDLRTLMLRVVPTGRSEDLRTAIFANDYDNDMVRMIMQRAKLRIDKYAASLYRRKVIRVPFTIDSYVEARLLRLYDGVENIISTQNKYATDYEFQTHKHYMIQNVLRTLCRLEFEPEDQTVNRVYFDGLSPSDYGLIHVTNPRLCPYDLTQEPAKNLANYVVNLFDSNYSYTDILMDLSYKRKIGAELFVIMPYDHRMTTLYSANVLEGSYSFEWVRDGIGPRSQDYYRSERLPSSFFTRNTDVTYTLRIRPFRSNRVFTITQNEFFHLLAAGNNEGFYAETRRVSHGFAEISVVAFRPVHMINNTELREIKRPNLPYGKMYLNNNVYSDRFVNEFVQYFSKSLAPPFNYVIDEKVYNRTKKAAIQIRITRNNIVPLIYHLFAYSTHIVFNGAIVTIQKVMGPELICQLTEQVLTEIMPLKLRILQAGVLIKSPTEESMYMDFMRSAVQMMYLNTSNIDIDLDNINMNEVVRWIKDPDSYLRLFEGTQRTETFISTPGDNVQNS